MKWELGSCDSLADGPVVGDDCHLAALCTIVIKVGLCSGQGYRQVQDPRLYLIL